MAEVEGVAGADRALHRRPAGGERRHGSRSAARSTGTAGSSPTSRAAAPPRSTPPWPPRGGRSRHGPLSDPTAATSILTRLADAIDAAVPDLAAVESADNGSLHEAMSQRVLPRAANNVRFFADYARERLAEPPRTLPRRRAQPRPPRPGRRRRGLDALERAVHARHLARRAGARGRQHRGAQAAGVGAADLLAARRPRRRGRAAPGRAQHRARHRRGGGRAADRAPRRRPRRVHRLAGDRAHRLPRRRGAAHAGVVRARRQVAVRRLRGRGPRRGGGHRRLPVRQLRPGLPGRHAAARPAVDPRRVPRALRATRASEIKVGDPREPRHDVRPAHPPGRARARHRPRRSARSRPARACCSAASR